MKIALITPVFPPYAAGMAMVAEAHARILAAAGHDVTVFAPLGKDGLRQNVNYHIRSLPRALRYGNAAYVPALRSYLRYGSFDRIVLEYPFIGGAEIFLFRDIPVAPLRLYYHMDLVGQGIMRTVFKTYNQLILPRILKKFPRVAVSSLDYAKTGLLRDAVASCPEKFTEIPIGVHLFSAPPTTIASEAKQSLKLLFVAALDRAHYFKGLPVLIRALSRIPEAHLVVVGDGDMREKYERQAATLGISDRVQFVGRVKQEDLNDYYRKADALILPSIDRSEAFGMVLLEAMASGCAVIASDLPGVRTLVRDNGLSVRPGDAEDLAAKIKELYTDPERRARMGARGREIVEEKYFWEKVGSEFVRWVTD